MARQADDVGWLAARMEAHDAVEWRSSAAAAFRHRLAEDLLRVRRCAQAVENAAALLRLHADALDGGSGPLIHAAGGPWGAP